MGLPGLVANEPGLFPCPGAWCQGLQGWFVVGWGRGRGPLARWSVGPRWPVSWVSPCFGSDLACFRGKPS